MPSGCGRYNDPFEDLLFISKQEGKSSLKSVVRALGWPLSVESENINDPVFASNALADTMRKQ
jgi:hypothetical protein